ncbi:MAG: cryptochrome/photolyase family protein [Acidimicrobiia bacterium]
MPDIALFTADLRVADNPVLMAAGPDAVPLFIAEPQRGDADSAPNQAAYLQEALADLDHSLRALGGSLVYREGPCVAEVAKVVGESGADRVHVAQGASASEQARIASLSRLGIPITVHSSASVVNPTELSPRSAPYFQRFTPYFNRWKVAARRKVLSTPRRLRNHSITGDAIPPRMSASTSPLREQAGELRARAAFGEWLETDSATYESSRDSLATRGTSRISTALRFGQLSPLEVAVAAEEHGAAAFVRQIAWRDFNHQLLFHRPDLEEVSLKPAKSPANIEVDEQLLSLWQQGNTGYPVIDAGMRQLRETGWMHNRSRMLTASFLTKHLGQDWRAGALWFRRWLTDADMANNQLGWQWVAGVGVDTNPWRMFNPILQSRRHDPQGRYIRTWVPQLATASADEVHDPSDRTRSRLGYPSRVIEHADAVARFKRRSSPPQA